ncbi:MULTISPECIES: DUF4364 family protein [Anaerotruncus]|uniref:DUF4364 family protein n=2 Tax=Anaerotruncus TaxID=244127 RepID=A0ABR7AA75_9FIRM|nr:MULTISPECIES: DUF4364 family protein [Anaerotruncus]MBC3937353.1 DUF4364 family protein [Anaerotruncus massiliensis (ex Togo et al. 2019)]MCQ4894611.1 DUF4364 family protein [Anaerotruncus sp. DFI.9.16]
MYEGFRAGVEPGGLTTDYEIKILICHVLKHIERPMPVSALIELFVGEGIGNYFEAASAAAALVKSGHIAIGGCEGEKCYTLTDLGESAAGTFEKTLPLSVREKAVDAANRYFIRRERRAHNKAEVQKADDGYLLTLTITDVGSDLLKLTILLPDEETCGRIRERFLDDPIVVYKGVVASLTGSFENVGALLDDVE